jgi:hypothetical protein
LPICAQNISQGATIGPGWVRDSEVSRTNSTVLTELALTNRTLDVKNVKNGRKMTSFCDFLHVFTGCFCTKIGAKPGDQGLEPVVSGQ